MYCSECGKKIADQSKFCSFCGTPIATIEMSNTNANIGSSFVESNSSAKKARKGMEIYLHDIMSLQFSISKLNNTLSVEKNPIDIHDNWFVWKRYDLKHPIFWNDFSAPYRRLYLSYSAKLNRYYYAFTSQNEHEDFFDYQGRLVNHQYGKPCCNSAVLSADIRKKFFTLPVIKNRLFSGPMVTNTEDTYWPSFTVYENKYRLEPFQQVITIIEDFEAAVKRREETYRKNLPIRQKKIQDIEREISCAKRILRDLYSVDVIPSKFRDIGCAYFIYQFFSTSNVSLENVFLHLDMDKIQSQLNTVIKNQQKEILQHAVMISQNKEIMAQNEMIFDELSSIHNNTISMNSKLDDIRGSGIEAARWARIAASHAETCAWLGVANYIKDL